MSAKVKHGSRLTLDQERQPALSRRDDNSLFATTRLFLPGELLGSNFLSNSSKVGIDVHLDKSRTGGFRRSMLTDHLTTDSFTLTDRFPHNSPGGARVGGAIDPSVPWHGLGVRERPSYQTISAPMLIVASRCPTIWRVLRCAVTAVSIRSSVLSRVLPALSSSTLASPLGGPRRHRRISVKSPFGGRGRNLHSRVLQCRVTDATGLQSAKCSPDPIFLIAAYCRSHMRVIQLQLSSVKAHPQLVP